MPDKSIDVLFMEMSVLKREMEDSLVVHHRLFDHDNFHRSNKEVKLHLMKLTSISKTIATLNSSIDHYLAMAEIRLACARARICLAESFKPVDTE